MKNNLIGMMAGVLCAVMVAGFVLVPIIDDIQITSGDSVTYSNPISDSNLYMRSIQDGDTFVYTSDGVNISTFTLNGEAVLSVNDYNQTAYHTFIFSDVFSMWNGSATSNLQWSSIEQTTIAYGSAGVTTVTYNNGTFHFNLVPTEGTEYDADFTGATWGYICCNEDDAEYFESVRTGNTPFYVKNANDVVCSGVYTTGELDTFYWYHNGQSGGNEGFTVSTECEMTLVSGTTDVYTTTPLTTVTDGVDTEEFTPFRIMIPLEVTGHATSGAVYNIFEIIPVMVILAILVGVVYAVFRGRD